MPVEALTLAGIFFCFNLFFLVPRKHKMSMPYTSACLVLLCAVLSLFARENYYRLNCFRLLDYNIKFEALVASDSFSHTPIIEK